MNKTKHNTSSNVQCGIDRTPVSEPGFMWEPGHIRLLSWRTKPAVSDQAIGAV